MLPMCLSEVTGDLVNLIFIFKVNYVSTLYKILYRGKIDLIFNINIPYNTGLLVRIRYTHCLLECCRKASYLKQLSFKEDVFYFY